MRDGKELWEVDIDAATFLAYLTYLATSKLAYLTNFNALKLAYFAQCKQNLSRIVAQASLSSRPARGGYFERRKLGLKDN